MLVKGKRQYSYANPESLDQEQRAAVQTMAVEPRQSAVVSSFSSLSDPSAWSCLGGEGTWKGECSPYCFMQLAVVACCRLPTISLLKETKSRGGLHGKRKE